MGADVADRVAANVRAERVRRRWSQAQLGRRIGGSQSMVSAIERGERRIALDLLVVLCRALEVPLTVLLDGSPVEDLRVLGVCPRA